MGLKPHALPLCPFRANYEDETALLLGGVEVGIIDKLFFVKFFLYGFTLRIYEIHGIIVQFRFWFGIKIAKKPSLFPEIRPLLAE